MQAMLEGLGPKFLGTSNCLIAMRREVEAIGTNAHELPMVYAALADDDKALAEAPYDVLADWQQDYDGNLRVILPDTFGTKGFLDAAPDWIAQWTGIRIDSGDPVASARAGHRLVAKRAARTRARSSPSSPTASTSTIIERCTATSTAACASASAGARCSPTTSAASSRTGRLDPFSIVCKVLSADGRPAVKLSDNPSKAVGPAAEIERYRRVFGVGQQAMVAGGGVGPVPVSVLAPHSLSSTTAATQASGSAAT